MSHVRTEFDGNLIICNIQEMAFLNLLQERFIIMKERERERERKWKEYEFG